MWPCYLAVAGLSWVFYNTPPKSLPLHSSYCQLSHYHDATPYTLPAYLLANVAHALSQYPQRYQLLHNRLHAVLQHPWLKQWLMASQHYPTAISYTLPLVVRENAHLNGLFLHQQSQYLHSRQWSQISVIQPSFEEDWLALSNWLNATNTWHSPHPIPCKPALPPHTSQKKRPVN